MSAPARDADDPREAFADAIAMFVELGGADVSLAVEFDGRLASLDEIARLLADDPAPMPADLRRNLAQVAAKVPRLAPQAWRQAQTYGEAARLVLDAQAEADRLNRPAGTGRVPAGR